MSLLTVMALKLLTRVFRPQATQCFTRLLASAATSKDCIKLGLSDQLFNSIAEQCAPNNDKVTVVGTGDVGMACTFCMLSQGISSDVAIIDMNQNKMKGELKDLQHGCLYLNAKVSAGADYSATAGSRVCVITAGVRQKKGESRLDLVQRNTDVLKVIVPNLVKHSPETILIIVTNPCDIMAWVAWKLSGLPKNRVMSSGTCLDTARFRFFLSNKFGISPESVHGWVIGEHGDSSVALWSGVNIAGVRLKDLNPKVGTDDDPENFKNLHKQVISAAYDVIKLKGFTSWGIGVNTSTLVKSILTNNNKIHAVGTYVKGMCGVDQEVFLSLPATLGKNGVSKIVDVHPAEEELCAFKLSADKMMEIICDINM